MLLWSEGGQILLSPETGYNDQTGNDHTYYFLAHKPPPVVALAKVPLAER